MFKIRQSNQKWWLLVAMGCALALVCIDQTAFAVAVPFIQRDLNLTNAMTLWVINAYLLAIAALVLLGGKTGDVLGLRRAFLFGIVLFISSSIECALSQTGIWIILGRALQGIGAAFMTPSSAALVINAFDENERGKAMGIYVAIAATFLSFGPSLGGIFTQWISWRAIFWINFPVAITSIFLTLVAVPKTKQATPTSYQIDWLGFILSTIFTISLTLALIEMPRFGWLSVFTLGLLLLALVSFSGFIFWEKRAKNPLVELTLFKNLLFSKSVTLLFIMQTAFMVFIFWAIFFQVALMFKPDVAGFLLLPATVPIIFMAPITGLLRDRYGYQLPMTIGNIFASTSLFWIASASVLHEYYLLFPGLLLFGLGTPLVISTYMTNILDAVQPNQRGIASGVSNYIRQLATSVGFAVFASLLQTIDQIQLSGFLKHAQAPLNSIQEKQIDGLLTQAPSTMSVLKHLSTKDLALLHEAAVHAYTHAFSLTMYSAATIAVVGSLFAFKNFRKLTGKKTLPLKASS